VGAIIVLTPLMFTAWPAVSTAIVGAAAGMGFALRAASAERVEKTLRKVETDIENSDVVAEGMNRDERIIVQKDDVTIEFGRDARGRCTVCVIGENRTEKELKAIGEEIAGRVVQQYAYHKLVTELKRRNFSVVEEKVMQDQSIQVRVRL